MRDRTGEHGVLDYRRVRAILETMRKAIDEDKLAECLCEECPSYPKAVFPKKDGVYCITGQDPRISERKGCNCKRCSVGEEIGASGSFFCLDGPAD